MGWKDDLIATYVARQAVRIGQFTLAGGGTSTLYIDGRRVSTYPKGLRAICDGMIETIRARDLLPSGCNLVAPVISGIPIVSAISLALDVPFVMDRGKPKQHGLGQYRSKDLLARRPNGAEQPQFPAALQHADEQGADHPQQSHEPDHNLLRRGQAVHLLQGRADDLGVFAAAQEPAGLERAAGGAERAGAARSRSAARRPGGVAV